MKLISVALLLALLAGCALSGEARVEEAAFAAVNAADAIQTAQIRSRAGYTEAESRWAIGAKPKAGNVATYFAGAEALHLGVAYLMRDWPKWMQRTFEGLTIGESGGCVVWNASSGL